MSGPRYFFVVVAVAALLLLLLFVVVLHPAQRIGSGLQVCKDIFSGTHVNTLGHKYSRPWTHIRLHRARRTSG